MRQVQIVFLSDLHKERLKPGREVTIGRKGCEPADAVRERDDSVLMTFVRLPKGTFYMGWDGEAGFGEEDGDQGGLRDRGPRRDAGAVAGGHGQQPELVLSRRAAAGTGSRTSRMRS